MRSPRTKSWGRPLAVATVALGLTALGAPALKAQSRVSGVVLEDVTDRPVAGVEVRLIQVSGSVVRGAVTDSAGGFGFEAGAGEYRFVAERLGYARVESEPIELSEGQEVRIDVVMSAVAVPLDAVTVTVTGRTEPARIVEFRQRAEENRRLGRGRVYLREDLERLQPTSAEALVSSIPWGSRCQPEILVDGLPPVESLAGIRSEDIEGVEMYRGVTQIPQEYYSYGMCGLAMIWLRVDPPGARPLSWGRVVGAGIVLALLALFSR
jgi:Carboxypeptidase regulatory-like domain